MRLSLWLLDIGISFGFGCLASDILYIVCIKAMATAESLADYLRHARLELVSKVQVEARHMRFPFASQDLGSTSSRWLPFQLQMAAFYIKEALKATAK